MRIGNQDKTESDLISPTNITTDKSFQGFISNLFPLISSVEHSIISKQFNFDWKVMRFILTVVRQAWHKYSTAKIVSFKSLVLLLVLHHLITFNITICNVTRILFSLRRRRRTKLTQRLRNIEKKFKIVLVNDFLCV